MLARLTQIEKDHPVPSIKEKRVSKMFRTFMPHGCEFDEEKKQISFHNYFGSYLGCDKDYFRISPFITCRKFLFYNDHSTPLSSEKAFERYKTLLSCFKDYTIVTHEEDPKKGKDIWKTLKQCETQMKRNSGKTVDILSTRLCEDVAQIVMKYLEVEPHQYAPVGDPRRKDPLYRVCHHCDLVFHTFTKVSKKPRTKYGFMYACLFLKRDRLGLDWIKKRENDDDKIEKVVEKHLIGPVCSKGCQQKLDKILVKQYDKTEKIPDKTEFDDCPVFDHNTYALFSKSECLIDYSRKAREQHMKELEKINHIVVREYQKSLQRACRLSMCVEQ